MSAEALLEYLAKHEVAPLTEVLRALLKSESLDEAIRDYTTLADAAFVKVDCRITLSLTPMGKTLAESMREQ